MTKVAILGGGFNPPTIAHVQLCEFVLENTDVEEVWMMPCNKHRFKPDLEFNMHRIRMCAIACRTNPKIHAFDYEMRHYTAGSTYYTTNLLLADPELDIDFSFIIGSDNLNEFKRWHHHEKLRKMIRFIVVNRPGTEINKKLSWYKKPPHIFLEPGDKITECSSTSVRFIMETVGRSKRIPHLDEQVQWYIQDNCLYSPPEEIQLKETHNRRRGWLWGDKS